MKIDGIDDHDDGDDDDMVQLQCSRRQTCLSQPSEFPLGTQTDSSMMIIIMMMIKMMMTLVTVMPMTVKNNDVLNVLCGGESVCGFW